MENSAKDIVELSKPVQQLDRGQLVAVHESYKVADLEQFLNGRNRARGALTTPSFEDFKSYVLQHSESGSTPTVCSADQPYVAPQTALVFVDHKNVAATAILNFTQEDFAQGHCDHKATLKLEPTVVWEKLNKIKDGKFNQKSFATLLEDWAGVFVALTPNNETISIGEALNAVRNMKISATSSSESQVTNLSESRSVLENVEASTTVGKLPAYFEIKDTAYVGLDEKTIKLRLLTNDSEGSPVFALQIVKEELLRNEIIQEFKNKVIALLPDNEVRIGTFTA
ncbi:DUF2303 family protein [Acinetobacter tandoii]|uniref:DUF2303 family protein n=1 Tax=Acinetobacter tandoii DSM 14970 = CIP 107469 TaxID=1120927 RepID=R9B721_9GAMM|nr:DUF2303 family protein [Acinetobacter tandoii]EOR08186.1 hypothetical protein I593_01541 [Acinetobacter tandoii DSM 14970 = CIP 107469]